jgi:hypothetical protein
MKDQVPEAPSKEEYCLNCGAVLTGNYCVECGQKAGIIAQTTRAWISELFDSLTDIDSKTLRTLRLTLAKPGYLAKEYVEGKRTQYISPLRLYLVVSAPIIALATTTGLAESLFTREVAEFVNLVDKEAEIISTINFVFPLVNAFSPFLTAGFLKILYPRVLYPQHFVLSLYYGTATLIAAIPLLFYSGQIAHDVFLYAVSAAYSGFAMRQFYGGGWKAWFVRWLAFMLVGFGLVRLILGNGAILIAIFLEG